MAALMTSMRLNQIVKLSKVVENKCVLCLKPISTDHKLRPVSRSFSTGAASSESQSETGEKEKKDDAKKSKFMKYLPRVAAASAVTLGICTVYTSGAPDLDAEGQVIKDNCSDYPFPIAYVMRSYQRFNHEVKVTKEPSREKLLPDPLTYPYLQPKYTIVIEMTDILVHPQWNFQTGWRFKKRPGIDLFLRAIGPPLFEVVIFTKESGMTGDPIITKADPENFIMYRLYRDSTNYEDGVHIKDLRYLNRDLSKVIMIDWDKQAVQRTPENGFYVKKWTGENNDTVLGELAEFLRAIEASNVDDVRPVLQYYSQFDDPLAKFHENQIKLKEEQDRQARAIKQQTDKSLSGLSSLWRKR